MSHTIEIKIAITVLRDVIEPRGKLCSFSSGGIGPALIISFPANGISITQAVMAKCSASCANAAHGATIPQ